MADIVATDPVEDVKMPLTEHLEELRWRLIRAILAVSVAFGICYYFSEQLFQILTEPILNMGIENVELIGTGVAEAFFTKLKVSLIAAVFLASPVIFYQIWRFIAPGLYESERRYALPFAFFATLFFVSGAAFCYKIVFPVGYRFFVEQYETIRVTPSIRISEYLSFSSRMLLAFGATFEMPVFTFFLSRVGLVDHRMMLSYFRYAILGIFIIAAMLTPGPDVASQFLMAAPLFLLYVFSIGVAYVFAKERPQPTSDTPGEESGNTP